MPAVKDFMTKNVITIDASKTVIEAADLMQACWNCFSARAPFPSSSTTNYLDDRLFVFVKISSIDQIPLASADVNTPDLRFGDIQGKLFPTRIVCRTVKGSGPWMQQRMIRKEVVVNASVEAVWDAWTTPEGAVTFFAPKADIRLAVGGPYELFFDLDAPVGSRGSEGLKVLSFLPLEMLSFEWNAPPQYPTVRQGQRTWVVVQFYPHGQNEVRVRLTHLGWREGEEWDKVFQYFKRAWDIVLGRLECRFSKGPIDWNNRYSPPQNVTYELP